MTPEEFLNEIRKSEERLKQAEQKDRACTEQLTADLVEHVYNWYPEWQPKREATVKQIAKTAEECAEKVLDLFGSIVYQCKRKEPVEKKHSIPKPDTRKQSEKELQKVLPIIPEEHHEYMKQIHWEEFEWEQHHQGFCFEAHRLMKKALTDHFPDDVLELEAGYFRKLDSFIYYLGACLFVEECYETME